MASRLDNKEIQERGWLDKGGLYCVAFQRRKLRPERLPWSSEPDLVHGTAHTGMVCRAAGVPGAESSVQ